MTRKDMMQALVENFGLANDQAHAAVQMMFDSIIEALATEGRIELRNFGVFEVRRRAPRNACNPKTGVRVHVPERLGVMFKPGKAMRKRIEGSGVARIPRVVGGPSKPEHEPRTVLEKINQLGTKVQGMTQAELARAVGCSRERIRQLLPRMKVKPQYRTDSGSARRAGASE